MPYILCIIKVMAQRDNIQKCHMLDNIWFIVAMYHSEILASKVEKSIIRNFFAIFPYLFNSVGMAFNILNPISNLKKSDPLTWQSLSKRTFVIPSPIASLGKIP